MLKNVETFKLHHWNDTENAEDIEILSEYCEQIVPKKLRSLHADEFTNRVAIKKMQSIFFSLVHTFKTISLFAVVLISLISNIFIQKHRKIGLERKTNK